MTARAIWARLCSEVRPNTTRSARLFLAHDPSVRLLLVCPSSSVASASSPLSAAGQVMPASGMSDDNCWRVPHSASQPSCTYWPCQVATGSFISNCVCGAKTPLTSQNDTVLVTTVSRTSAEDVTLPGAFGTPVKFICASEAHDVTGRTGPAAGLRDPGSAPAVPADAGPLTPSSIAATSGTTSPRRGHARRCRFIRYRSFPGTQATPRHPESGGVLPADGRHANYGSSSAACFLSAVLVP